jgi:two-component system, OmpR family, sensor histidine kinase KdpD
MSRRLYGSILGVVCALALGAAMIPLRPHLSVATNALVLVVPVVAGVATGGLLAGIVSVAAGFLVYDLFFVPPYYSMSVGTAHQDWVALAVYVVVMVIVALVVSRLADARSASIARAKNARHLFELSELLLAERSLEDLGQSIVQSVQDYLGLSGVALLLSVQDHLEVVASSGVSIGEEELAGLRTGTSMPVPLSTGMSKEVVRTLALATSGRPVGLLVMRGPLTDQEMRELLPTLANHLALALERAQLHERALRAEVLEEVDRLRRALVGAVSHDLRTPLATMKVASTTLLDSSSSLSDTDAKELYNLIDLQTDRLTRLVTSLLDMTRLEAGVLEVEKVPWSVADLVTEALSALSPSLGERPVGVEVGDEPPEVEVDHLLIGQALSNLLDNANRHAPPGTEITVAATSNPDGTVAISVTDRGPGVAPRERESVFESFVRFDTGGRAGLGLALAKTFVEAHGGHIWVEDAPGGGARFVFTLPVASTDEALRGAVHEPV